MKKELIFSLLLLLILSACGESNVAGLTVNTGLENTGIADSSIADEQARPAYDPGTLVPYEAQTGDTLQSLAARFNTSVLEIMRANPVIPENVSTLPSGFPMQIPIYYRAFWGSQLRILPDGHYPNGPHQSDFDIVALVNESNGWLKDYSGTAAREVLSGIEIIELVATNFSISPRLIISLIEDRGQGLTDFAEPSIYPLGYETEFYEGLYLQLVWMANTLNNGYYGWRSGKLIEFELQDGSLYRPDPWQNASSVAIQYLYAQLLPIDQFEIAISANGLALVYAELFNDPWEDPQDHIPGSLQQPELRLPFISGETWTFTGGPHSGWGQGEPWAAVDFAPGVETSGCVQSQEWATAVADGLVVRTGEGIVALDLDQDGDERTGWVIFYLHIESRSKAKIGSLLLAGQPLGHPSCEGGSSTGTHIHVARKFNGEWMLAGGDVAFILEGWEVQTGEEVYSGELIQPGRVVSACRCSDATSSITSIAEAIDFPTPSTFDLPIPTVTASPNP